MFELSPLIALKVFAIARLLCPAGLRHRRTCSFDEFMLIS
jgi:hypothetical protein